MKRQEYDEAKRLLAQIRQELDGDALTPEQRQELERHAARLAGALLHPWLPVYWSRRLWMAAEFLAGIFLVAVGHYYIGLLLLLFLPTFSPRMMGEAAFLWGRLSRDFSDGFVGKPRRE